MHFWWKIILFVKQVEGVFITNNTVYRILPLLNEKRLRGA